MHEAKSFASLSSGLLARKGGAKPAMRPQGFGQMGAGLDDLGWNDMGFAAPQPQPATVTNWDDARRPTPAVLTPPPVLRQQEDLAASFAAPQPSIFVDDVEPVPAALETRQPSAPPAASAETPPPADLPKAAPSTDAPTLRRAAGAKPKAAFTLRLDSERHLRLRLACAVTHRSAQALVTEAVDAFLSTMPDVETLAGRMPSRGAAA